MADWNYRVCSITGKKIHDATEKLILANAVTAVVFLLIGGLFGFLIAMTRWESVHLLTGSPPGDQFYRFLTEHGWNMLLFWIIFLEIAILYAAGPVLLNSRHPSPALGWAAYGRMLVGAIIVELVVLSGVFIKNPSGIMEMFVIAPGADQPLLTSYLPLEIVPGYYIGVLIFAVGALLGILLFFWSLYVAKQEETYEGSLPLVTFGGVAAGIIGIEALLSGVIAYVPALLQSLGLIGAVDPQFYRIAWWGIGHSTQQINVTAMIAVWYFLAFITLGAKAVNEKVCRTAFVLYILFINLASAHHILVDPGASPAWKIWNTSYAAYAAVLASMIHAYTVPASMEVKLREDGYDRGLFEWLRKAPWSRPEFSFLIWSIIGFGFVGGITGVIMGTEQLNIRAHNTWAITGHFHGTVVLGTTMAFMGLLYVAVPLFAQKEIVYKNVAKWVPHIYGVGMLAVITGMIFAGLYGVPRRHYDITTFGGSWTGFDPTASLWLTVVGIGAIIAAIGGLLFCLQMVASLLMGDEVTGEESLEV